MIDKQKVFCSEQYDSDKAFDGHHICFCDSNNQIFFGSILYFFENLTSGKKRILIKLYTKLDNIFFQNIKDDKKYSMIKEFFVRVEKSENMAVISFKQIKCCCVFLDDGANMYLSPFTNINEHD